MPRSNIHCIIKSFVSLKEEVTNHDYLLVHGHQPVATTDKLLGPTFDIRPLPGDCPAPADWLAIDCPSGSSLLYSHRINNFFCDFIKGKCLFASRGYKGFFCTASTLSVTVEMAPQVFRGCVMLYWQGKVFCNPTTTTVKSQNATNHIVLGNNIILWSTAFMRQICFLLPGEWWYRCSCVGK